MCLRIMCCFPLSVVKGIYHWTYVKLFPVGSSEEEDRCVKGFGSILRAKGTEPKVTRLPGVRSDPPDPCG